MAIDRQTVRTQGRRVVRKVARTVPLSALASLPAQGGPLGHRALLAQARLLLGTPDGTERGLALLQSVPDSARDGATHSLMAQALVDLGRPEQARVHVESALADGTPNVQGVVTGLRVARALKDSALLGRMQDLATRAVPRDAREADLLVVFMPTDDTDLAARFVENARTRWPVDVDATALARYELETAILSAGDTEQQLETARHLAAQSAVGLRAATRVLPDLHAWEALREIYRAAPAEHVEQLYVRHAQSAASRALRAGWVETTAAICERLIETAPTSRQVRRLHQEALDVIHTAEVGWPVDAPRPRAYEPRPRAVLSLLAQSLPHRSGGYATRSHGVITGLAALGWDMEAVTRLGFPYDRSDPKDRTEVEPFDVVDGITYRRLLEPGERVYDDSPLAPYIERFARRLEDEARRHGAALIHASSFQNNGLAGLRAARRLGIPFVYEMRGLEDLMKVSRRPAFATTSAYRWMTGLETHIAQQADLTFVITEALREEMIRRGAPADRLVVLPNGVHTAQFEPRQPDQALIDELGLAGKTVIGYAGGLVDYEGLDLLLRAAATLKAERDDFAVIIVGDGHMEPHLHALARDLDVSDVVQFTGRVPHAEVARYISIFQITPFPRLPLPVCELISPIKPFESMAMGKAVISSSVAALTEIVEADVRGLVFEKGDADDLAAKIRTYLDDPALRERLGRQAREWVLAERDWSDICRIVDGQYHRLLD